MAVLDLSYAFGLMNVFHWW